MELAENRFKTALKHGRRQIGLWSNLNSPIAAEIVAGSGFDWIVIDMEHGINELPSVAGQLQAMAQGTATPVVRPPWNDFVAIKRLLDAGATSLLVPYVQDRREAEAAARAITYPPHGNRGVASTTRATGFGRIKNYHEKAAGQLCLVLQVETAEALDCLEEIASVDGVDGIFIGPSDLAASMGHLGEPGAERVQKAIRQAAERLRNVGKPAGILSSARADAERYIEWGYQFVAVGLDSSLLARNADELAAHFKAAGSPG